MGHGGKNHEDALDVRSKAPKTKKKSEKLPLFVWGTSLFIHLLILLFVSNVFWLTQKKDVAGSEYDVGIVAGAQAEGLDLGTAQSPDMGQVERLQSIEEPVFEPEVVQDIQIELLEGRLQPSRAAATSAVESVYAGSSAAGQGAWANLSGGGGQGSGGASFFGLEAKGAKFVYVVDRSGSMSGSSMAAAKNEIVRSVMSMDDKMEVCVFFYDDACLAMEGGRLLKATDENKRRILSWVAQIGTGGGTDPGQAMTRALSLKPDAIWLLSDGQFSAGCVDSIRRNNRGGRVIIHTIAFFRKEGEAVLRRIANENRGRYRFVRQP